MYSTVVIIKKGFFYEKKNQFILEYTKKILLLTVLAKISTRKNLCKENSCFILIIMSLEDICRHQMQIFQCGPHQISIEKPKWPAKIPYFLLEINK